MTAAPTILITAADGHGVPTAARCPLCDWRWQRPAGDEWADTLPIAARAHRAMVPCPPVSS